jgi:drug/metabolite transporter (DMT)-like permease
MTALRGRRLAVYLFLCAVWGSTWMVIKIGLRDLPPLWFAGIRMALACLLLAPVALSRGRFPSRPELAFVALSGSLQIALSYAFLFIASQWIESGLAAILFSSFPIWVGLFAHFLLADEPLTARAVAAASAGLAGVAIIEGPAAAGPSATPGRLVAGGSLVFGSAIVSALANVLNKKFLSRVHPAVNVWGQTLVGSALLLAAALTLERGAPARWTASAFASLAYLALFGTALTFAGLFWLIPRVPVAVIGTIPLVDTFVAVLLGSLILGERLSARILVGGGLILAGVLLAARRPRSRSVAA